MNTAIYDVAPDIPERLRKRGDEILGHGHTNSDEQGQLSETAERALIAQVTKTIERHEGAKPVGWMSPWLSNSLRSMDLLQEAGYRYAMDWTMDDQPIWIRTRKGRILAMPYPIEVNDTRGMVWYRYTADEFAEMIIDQFDEMLEQSARQPLVCPISLHPFVIGRPYRIRRLRRAFEHIPKHRDRIWLTRPREICAHIESLPAGIVPGEPVTSWILNLRDQVIVITGGASGMGRAIAQRGEPRRGAPRALGLRRRSSEDHGGRAHGRGASRARRRHAGAADRGRSSSWPSASSGGSTVS